MPSNFTSNAQPGPSGSGPERASIGATKPGRARFSRGTADRLLELIRDAFAAGMQWAFRLVAALALLGVLVPVLYVGGSLLRPRETAGEKPGAGASA
jgi:hypothetical protein